MQFVDKILFQINTEIEKLGIDDCMGIDSAFAYDAFYSAFM